MGKQVALAAYKKHKLHWGEAAQFLMKHTDYEVPFLHKQMAKWCVPARSRSRVLC